MKVLHFYRTYFPDTQGGLEEAIRQICINTQPLGADNVVLTLSDKPEPEHIQRPEALVVRNKMQLDIASCSMGVGSFSEFKRLAKWADVINLHYPWPFSDMVSLLMHTTTPIVITYHSDVVRQKLLGTIYRPLQTPYLRRANRIVATSQHYAASSLVLPNYADKLSIIPLGIKESSYPQPTIDTLSKVRREHGEGFLLFVGVLRYYKAVHILLEAINGAPYNLVVVGSGALEDELRQQADRLHLDNVTFTGYVSDEVKSALYQLSSAVVLPSHLRSEAFGVSLVEGAMFGKPLISAEVGTGTSFVNRHGYNGLVVRPNNKASLRAAMDQLMLNPAEAQRMGRNSRAHFEAQLNGALLGQRYMDLYQDVVSASQASPALSY